GSLGPISPSIHSITHFHSQSGRQSVITDSSHHCRGKSLTFFYPWSGGANSISVGMQTHSGTNLHVRHQTLVPERLHCRPGSSLLSFCGDDVPAAPLHTWLLTLMSDIKLM